MTCAGNLKRAFDHLADMEALYEAKQAEAASLGGGGPCDLPPDPSGQCNGDPDCLLCMAEWRTWLIGKILNCAGDPGCCTSHIAYYTAAVGACVKS